MPWRRFIDESAASAVHDERAFVHEGDAVRVENVVRLRSHRDVECDDIGSGQGFVSSFREFDFK